MAAMNYELKNTSIKAIIFELSNDYYAITTENKGGPIISAATVEEAKIKFSEALKICCALSNLRYFSKNEERKNGSSNDSELEVEYSLAPSF